MQYYWEIVKVLTALFNQAGIRYCILHGWQSLPETFQADLDIVVLPEDLGALERAVRNNDFGGRIVQLVHYQTTGFHFDIAVESPAGFTYLPIDVTTDYRWRGCIYFRAEELLRDRRQWNGVWVAGPEAEFSYLIVKKIVKQAFPAHQRVRLHELQSILGDTAHAISTRLLGAWWGSRLVDWLARSEWTPLEACVGQLKRTLHWRMVRSDPFTLVRYWLPELLRFWRRWRYPSGFFIAVLGPDGAGKSTLIQQLQTSLQDGFRRTAVFHWRPWLFGCNANDEPVTEPHAKPPYTLLPSLAKLGYYLTDFLLGYWFQVRPALARSTLVLFDRYYDDLLVDPYRYRYGGPHWLARWVGYLIPRPDVFLFVDGSEECLLERKQELPREELRRQRSDYQQLAARRPNAVLLDGSQPEPQVVRQTTAIVVDLLHERYFQRRDLWFSNNAQRAGALPQACSALTPSCPPTGGTNARCHSTARRAARHTDQFGLARLPDGRGYLIPLAPRQAAVSALTLYNPQRKKAQLVRSLLVTGLQLGVAQPFLHRLSPQDSRRDGKGQNWALLLEHLESVVGEKRLSFAISLGTPGPHQKPVIQIMNGKGHILAYAKVGQDAATNALVQNEVHTLRMLAVSYLQIVTTPRVLHSGWWGKHFLCILSAPQGKPQRAPQTLTPLHLAALKELRALRTSWMPLPASAFWGSLRQRAVRVTHPYYRHILEQGIATAEAWVGNTPLPFSLSHGDFTSWNMKQDTSHLFVLDWEYAANPGAPTWDLFHFVFQMMWLLNKWDAHTIYASLMEQGRFQRSVEDFCVAYHGQDSYLRPFLLLYLLDRLAFWAVTAPRHPSLLRTLSVLIRLLMVKL